MEKFCPINRELVDSKLIRANAFVIFSALSVYLFTSYDIIIYFVFADFTVRAFWGFKYSPVCKVVRYSLDLAKISPTNVNAGPKKLAAKFGLTFSVLIILSNLFDFNLASTVIATIFCIASGLEAFLDFCLVCKIYPYLNKFGLIKH